MFSISTAAESQNMQTVLLFSRTRKKHPKNNSKGRITFHHICHFFGTSLSNKWLCCLRCVYLRVFLKLSGSPNVVSFIHIAEDKDGWDGTDGFMWNSSFYQSFHCVLETCSSKLPRSKITITQSYFLFLYKAQKWNCRCHLSVFHTCQFLISSVPLCLLINKCHINSCINLI